MADVLIVKRGSIDRASIGVARKAGIVVVQVDELTDAKFVRASETIGHSDMLWAAMEALVSGTEYGAKAEKQRERLANNLFALMDAARKADRSEPEQVS